MKTRSFVLARGGVLAGAALAVLSACAPAEEQATPESPTRVAGRVHVVRDTIMPSVFEASGTAQPLQQATLSTKLMGTVTAVLVQEGDHVQAGQPLVRLDARDLAAKEAQVAASITDAEAMHRDAQTQAARIRALYADSAATKAQLEAVETGLARATAGLRAARAAGTELDAVSSYATIRAPFAGIITQRFVDPGAFAAPGAPLLAIQDASHLRIAVSAAPDAVRGLRRGMPIPATIEGQPVGATVEGIVPGMGGNLYTVNALVVNRAGAILSGSAATLSLPIGERNAIVVPAAAVTREGDLTGVTVRTPQGDEIRWVRLGGLRGTYVEVSGGLRAGDQVVVPATGQVAAAAITEGN